MSFSRLSAVLAALVLAALAAVPAGLAEDGDVRVIGTCTAGSTVELKVGPEDGGLEVELEVDQNRNGVPWNVTIRRNGKLVVSRTAVTRRPSGSFEVERVISNAAGKDRVVAVATRRSGETCRAVVVF